MSASLLPAAVFVTLALFTVLWLLRRREKLASKRVVEDLKAHQVEQADRIITTLRGQIILAQRVKPTTRAPKRRPTRSSTYDERGSEPG